MKKLVVSAVLSLLMVSNASAFFFNRDCGGCRTRATVNEVNCEPRPVCYKMVRKECPARKVCETNCHYVCPPDTIREDCGDDNGGY